MSHKQMEREWTEQTQYNNGKSELNQRKASALKLDTFVKGNTRVIHFEK